MVARWCDTYPKWSLILTEIGNLVENGFQVFFNKKNSLKKGVAAWILHN